MKEKLQGRVETEDLELLRIVGKMLNIETDSELVNYMVKETLVRSKGLLENYESMYIPQHIRENTWIRMESDKYVKWSFVAPGFVQGEIFEVFSDLCVNHQKIMLPRMFKNLQEKFNSLTIDYKINDDRSVTYYDGYKEDMEESEGLIIQYYLIESNAPNLTEEYIDKYLSEEEKREEITSYMHCLGIGESCPW